MSSTKFAFDKENTHSFDYLILQPIAFYPSTNRRDSTNTDEIQQTWTRFNSTYIDEIQNTRTRFNKHGRDSTSMDGIQQSLTRFNKHGRDSTNMDAIQQTWAS